MIEFDPGYLFHNDFFVALMHDNSQKHFTIMYRSFKNLDTIISISRPNIIELMRLWNRMLHDHYDDMS